jgi:hypothetical protein
MSAAKARAQLGVGLSDGVAERNPKQGIIIHWRTERRGSGGARLHGEKRQRASRLKDRLRLRPRPRTTWRPYGCKAHTMGQLDQFHGRHRSGRIRRAAPASGAQFDDGPQDEPSDEMNRDGRRHTDGSAPGSNGGAVRPAR